MDDPTVTFSISLIALIASVLSGIGSIWALTQKWRYFPKPLMLRKVGRYTAAGSYDVGTDEFAEGDELLHFSVTNRGDGVAHDVHLTLHGPDGPTTETDGRELLQPGQTLQVSIYVSDMASQEDAHGGVNFSTAGANPKDFSAVLTWRQAPRMSVVRKRRLREKRK